MPRANGDGDEGLSPNDEGLSPNEEKPRQRGHSRGAEPRRLGTRTHCTPATLAQVLGRLKSGRLGEASGSVEPGAD